MAESIVSMGKDKSKEITSVLLGRSDSDRDAQELAEKASASKKGSNNPKKFGINRALYKVLVQTPNRMRSDQLRQSLKTLGFSEISCCRTQVEAIDRFKFRKFTHVIFDASFNAQVAYGFVEQLLELDEESILIAVSEEPHVDDVFGLLRVGTRHYLGIPFNVESLEAVLIEASEGKPLNEVVLSAPNRNSALVGVMLNNLYKRTVIMRQAREFTTAAKELKFQTRKFYQSVEMAKMFCEGTHEDLLEEIMEQCIKRAQTAASRLGRARKRLRSKRGDKDENSVEVPQ